MAIKRIHTEKEAIDFDQYQIFRLARLASKDWELFEEISQFVNFSVYFNDRQTLDMTYANKKVEEILDLDTESILDRGYDLILEISDKSVLAHTSSLISSYDLENNPNKLCSFPQRVNLKGQDEWLFTHKLIFDEVAYLNCGYTIQEIGKPGELISKILDEVFVERDGWSKYNALQNRELEIMQLMAQGFTSKELSEILFISEHTVKTHRKNIYKKLDVKNLADLIRFVQAFEMI